MHILHEASRYERKLSDRIFVVVCVRSLGPLASRVPCSFLVEAMARRFYFYKGIWLWPKSCPCCCAVGCTCQLLPAAWGVTCRILILASTFHMYYLASCRTCHSLIIATGLMDANKVHWGLEGHRKARNTGITPLVDCHFHVSRLPIHNLTLLKFPRP